VNLYGYVMNDPVNFVDVVGLWSIFFDYYTNRLGGGFTFGRNPGKCGDFFFTIRLGLGYGGGLLYDPNGVSTGYKEGRGKDPNFIGLGGFIGGDVGIGPIKLALGSRSEIGIGPDPELNLETKKDSAFGDSWGNDMSDYKGFGGRLTLSGGAQVSGTLPFSE